MRVWNFENGVKVHEMSFDYDLHCFDVFHNELFLGTVYPEDLETMRAMVKCLDEGEDPVSGKWEDGCGNICTMEGWGKDLSSTF